MNKGDFIKWTGQDEEGSFSHTGRIEAITETEVTFTTKDGQMTVPLTDGSFAPAKKVKLDVPAIKEVVAEVKAIKSGTKLERAVAIYKSMKDATRQKLIEAFVSQLEMTPAGASTYAAKVRKI